MGSREAIGANYSIQGKEGSTDHGEQLRSVVDDWLGSLYDSPDVSFGGQRKAINKTRIDKAMNENARKWIKALRSGEFKQGRYALKTQDTYCCLGVACEVYRRETGKGSWWPSQGDVYTFSLGPDSSRIEMPDGVRKWVGIASASNEFSIASWNDDGLPFEDIASELEEADLFHDKDIDAEE
jgi:hypothetical protein